MVKFQPDLSRFAQAMVNFSWSLFRTENLASGGIFLDCGDSFWIDDVQECVVWGGYSLTLGEALSFFCWRLALVQMTLDCAIWLPRRWGAHCRAVLGARLRLLQGVVRLRPHFGAARLGLLQ